MIRTILSAWLIAFSCCCGCGSKSGGDDAATDGSVGTDVASPNDVADTKIPKAWECTQTDAEACEATWANATPALGAPGASCSVDTDCTPWSYIGHPDWAPRQLCSLGWNGKKACSYPVCPVGTLDCQASSLGCPGGMPGGMCDCAQAAALVEAKMTVCTVAGDCPSGKCISWSGKKVCAVNSVAAASGSTCCPAGLTNSGAPEYLCAP